MARFSSYLLKLYNNDTMALENKMYLTIMKTAATLQSLSFHSNFFTAAQTSKALTGSEIKCK
jgi:hypothetical protein